jgi:hypothetical protein
MTGHAKAIPPGIPGISDGSPLDPRFLLCPSGIDIMQTTASDIARLEMAQASPKLLPVSVYH